MTWWEAMLWTAGAVGFWPALIVIGDPIDRWFQNRQAAALHRPGERDITIGGE